MSEWTILAPGPSLADAQVSAQGPVVAINSAVHTNIPFDFWCAQDPPHQFLPEIAVAGSPIVWCNERLESAWKDHGFRTWANKESEEDIRELIDDPLPSVTYNDLTIAITLARVISYGATEINLYGCDMMGVGYAFGEPNRVRTEDNWKSRWVNERKQVGSMIDHWNEQGLEIVLR